MLLLIFSLQSLAQPAGDSVSSFVRITKRSHANTLERMDGRLWGAVDPPKKLTRKDADPIADSMGLGVLNNEGNSFAKYEESAYSKPGRGVVDGIKSSDRRYNRPSIKLAGALTQYYQINKNHEDFHKFSPDMLKLWHDRAKCVDFDSVDITATALQAQVPDMTKPGAHIIKVSDS